MDNNNLTNQSIPNQPLPTQPVSQPAQPVSQPTPPANPYQYPPQYQNQQAYTGQPVQNVKPPKQPMDPAKKKKIILGVSIGSGVAILGIIAAIIIPMFLSVDYGASYRTSKELKSRLYELSDATENSDCQSVYIYDDRTSVDIEAYNNYAEECKKTFDGIDELVSSLGSSGAVSRNGEIKNKFSEFKEEYEKLDKDGFITAIDLRKALHGFVLTDALLNYGSSDEEFAEAANYLINSGNDTLKAYGEEWLEKHKDTAAAFRAYDAASTGPDSSSMYEVYNSKRMATYDWANDNFPSLYQIAPFKIAGAEEMYNTYTELHEMIANKYEENYNAGSDDCWEMVNAIICD